MRILHQRLLWLAILAMVLLGCESYQEDILADEKRIQIRESGTEFYTLPETPVLVDLKGRVKYSYIIFYVELLDQPAHGHVSKVDGSFLKYDPDPEFTSGEDTFRIAFYSEASKLLAVQKLSVRVSPDLSNSSCGLQAIGDRVKTRTGMESTVQISKNDLICSLDVMVSVWGRPKHGNAFLEGDYIRYAPDDGFTGSDHLIYQLQSKTDTSVTSYGYLDIQVTACDLSTERLSVDLLSAGAGCFDSNGLCLPELNQRISCIRDVASWMTIGLMTAPLYGLVTTSPSGEVYYQPLTMLVESVKNDSFQIQLKYKYVGEGESERLLRLMVNINRTPPAMSCLYHFQDVTLDLTDGQSHSTASLAGCSSIGYLIPFQALGPDCMSNAMTYQFEPIRQTRRSGTFCWDDAQVVYRPDVGRPPVNDTLLVKVQIMPASLLNVQRYVVKRN